MRLLKLGIVILATFSMGMAPKKLSLPKPKPLLPLQQKVLKQILKNNPKVDASYARNLAIIIVSKSEKYHIPVNVFTAILMQESAYRLDARHIVCGYRNISSADKTCVVTDLGISQIHHKNVDRFGLDRKRLMSDLDYSVDSGAMILANYSKFQRSEPKTWYSRYNCGTGAFGDIKDRCLAYKHRVDRYL